MLEKWLTKYPRPFLRSSAFTPEAPSPDELRDRLANFLAKASTYPRFEKELASLEAHLHAVKVASEEIKNSSRHIETESDTDNDVDEGGSCPNEVITIIFFVPHEYDLRCLYFR